MYKHSDVAPIDLSNKDHLHKLQCEALAISSDHAGKAAVRDAYAVLATSCQSLIDAIDGKLPVELPVKGKHK
jgi:hypothetical protein